MKRLLLVTAVIALAIPVVAAAVPATIYEIQDGTIPAGTRVEVQAVVVTAGSYELTASGAYIMVEEPLGGQYSGIEVYWGTAQAADYAHLTRGTAVHVFGVVGEYYDMTEIDVSAPGDTVLVCGTCTLPLDIITCADVDEPWEGVLVQIQCAETATEANTYGEWDIQDVTGSVICDDAFRIGYTPVIGEWNNVTGCLAYSYGAYKLWVRDINDIVPVQPSATDATSWGKIKALYQ
jgi:predicted extracellular nuclease